MRPVRVRRRRDAVGEVLASEYRRLAQDCFCGLYLVGTAIGPTAVGNVISVVTRKVRMGFTGALPDLSVVVEGHRVDRVAVNRRVVPGAVHALLFKGEDHVAPRGRRSSINRLPWDERHSNAVGEQ